MPIYMPIALKIKVTFYRVQLVELAYSNMSMQSAVTWWIINFVFPR